MIWKPVLKGKLVLKVLYWFFFMPFVLNSNINKKRRYKVRLCLFEMLWKCFFRFRLPCVGKPYQFNLEGHHRIISKEVLLKLWKMVIVPSEEYLEGKSTENKIQQNYQSASFSVTMSSIKCVRKISRKTNIFRKTNISYPLIRTRMCAYQEVRNVFRKILRTYYLYDP